MSIGERLKKARKYKKHTQESFAEKLDVSLGTYRNWEQNINTPTGEMIARLATALEVTSDFLLGKDDNMMADGMNRQSLKDDEKILLGFWGEVGDDEKQFLLKQIKRASKERRESYDDE